MGAFVERVSKRFRLTRDELSFLEQLESSPAPTAKGQMIAREGDPAERAFVLMSGWAMSYTRFPDGSQQVRRLHFPGDLLAMPSVPMRRYTEDIETLSNAVVAPFPKSLLARLFEVPRLAAIMYMFAQAERITLGDRLASLGRNSAKARIAFLLLEILHRLRSADESITCSFQMHLTREQIAHVTGMTPVHGSRMWSALIADGVVACNRRTVQILDEQRLAELAQYRHRTRDFDHAWLRSVEEAQPGGHFPPIQDKSPIFEFDRLRTRSA